MAGHGLGCCRLHFLGVRLSVCLCVLPLPLCVLCVVCVCGSVCRVLFSFSLCCCPVGNRTSLILWLPCCFYFFISFSFCCKPAQMMKIAWLPDSLAPLLPLFPACRRGHVPFSVGHG